MYVTTAMKHDARVAVEYVKSEEFAHSYISIEVRSGDQDGLQISMRDDQAHDLLAKLTEALKHE